MIWIIMILFGIIVLYSACIISSEFSRIEEEQELNNIIESYHNK